MPKQTPNPGSPNQSVTKANRSAPGGQGQSIPSTLQKSSPPKPNPRSQPNANASKVSVPQAVTVTSPTPPRNISDGSYHDQNGPSTTSAPTRISEQMTQAKSDPNQQKTSQKNIEQRKAARTNLLQRGPKHGLAPLNTRTESGVRSAFAAGSTIEHRRDPTTGMSRNQEAGRMARMPLNQRPSQRQHAAPVAPPLKRRG